VKGALCPRNAKRLYTDEKSEKVVYRREKQSEEREKKSRRIEK